MKSISQVAKITGVSVRTLQYYDEIGLLKPSGRTSSGYRLYDDHTLSLLQQILFFKELGFSLKEIREIIENPVLDKANIFKKQKELFQLKRSRIDRLIQLLDRLEKGEPYMSFKEFDLSSYIKELESFKRSHTEAVIKYWGSVENFNLFIEKITKGKEQVAQSAIQAFGSLEAYTAAMKHNMEHFSEFMEQWYAKLPDGMQIETLFHRLATLRDAGASSPQVQTVIGDIIHSAQENALPDKTGSTTDYCRRMIANYANDYLKSLLDTQHGAGYCDYIAEAFRHYLQHSVSEAH